jgi:hypothetical protein
VRRRRAAAHADDTLIAAEASQSILISAAGVRRS